MRVKRRGEAAAELERGFVMGLVRLVGSPDPGNKKGPVRSLLTAHGWLSPDG
jgi:hypothetical protein